MTTAYLKQAQGDADATGEALSLTVAAMLAELEVRSVRLMTNNPEKVTGLEAEGVVGHAGHDEDRSGDGLAADGDV